MKTLILLGILCTCRAIPLLIEPHGLPEVGGSTQYKTEDNLGNYAFGYDEDHTSGGSFRKEFGDSAGNKIGSYGLHHADGRSRVVNYVADSAGFRADVHTNEPGVDPSQDPADTTVNKPVVVAAAPAALVAPVAVAHHKGMPITFVHAVPSVLHGHVGFATVFSHGAHVLW